jgi:hypothetical protein
MGGSGTLNLLLDTHIILWAVSSPEKLSPPVLEALRNESNELWFSPVSAWEIFLLAEKSRIVLKPPFSECIRDISTQSEVFRHKDFRSFRNFGSLSGKIYGRLLMQRTFFKRSPSQF